MESRPKRRKHGDNPYIISYDKIENVCSLTFKDGQGILHCIEISFVLYELLNQFELDDVSEMNKFDRYIEHSELTEETLNKRTVIKPLSVDDEVIQKIDLQEIKNAISTLSEIQKRRVYMYFFEDMTLEQIAKKENCTFQAIKCNIDIALKKLSKIIKKF